MTKILFDQVPASHHWSLCHLGECSQSLAWQLLLSLRRALYDDDDDVVDDDDDDEKEEEKEEGDVELLTHSVQIFMLVENKPSLMIVVDDHTNLAVDDKYPPPDIVDGKK